jgi:quercetin dioxygenase-like cupin family protein
MAKIKFVSNEERRFVSFLDEAQTNPERWSHLAPSELVGEKFVHHEGSADEPQLFEVKFPGNHTVEAHAHEADEIIVVTEGEVHFGKQVFGAGSSVFIPKLTLYSFKTGPNGMTFLNFRPTKTARKGIFKDELMKMRSEKKIEST